MASERVEGVDPVAGAAAAPGAPEEAGEGLEAEAVVALCQVLDAAQYAEFMGELGAAPDAAHTEAVVRRWAAHVLAGAGRRRGAGREAARRAPPPQPADPAG